MLEKLKQLVYWGAIIVWLGLGVNWVGKCGRQWTFGRYWMPKILLAPDGMHFADGEPLDLIGLALVRSGHEEELHLALFTIVGLAVCWLVYELWKTRQMIIEIYGGIE